ncbi:DUF3857 and transglutaminase domain-containing protein [Pseudoduganella violaceinigra]|uniref:DUF3857 and transglutaminase domain-containing protein n=1 Tax=Pseudoduganella violaceinigra TaxID=246602 RepID=UPI0004238BA7|nr:DUF3857 and transglutaminase domain-containing protein [Pseudoduganella violaceinigra]
MRNLYLALLLLPCLAGAANREDSRDTTMTYERTVERWHVESDGSFVEEIETTLRVNAPHAVAAAATRAFTYNPPFGNMQILEAYTLKKDGRKLPVDLAAVREIQTNVSLAAPEYVDQRQKLVLFPGVAAGDRLVYRYRSQYRQALFPNHFVLYFPVGTTDYRQRTIDIDLPETMPLLSDNRGFRAAPPVRRGGRLFYHWDYASHPVTHHEAGAINGLELYDRLYVSTFPNYAALAKTYFDVIEPAARVTPDIEEKASAIVGDARSARSKADAIIGWVRSNIRHVPIDLNDAKRLAPHTAEEVLANRYADERDTLVLLRALLAAQKIDCTPALVNQDAVGSLPQAPSPDVLYRAIAYLPSLDLYVDPMENAIGTGYLSESLLDKPVLLASTGKIARTRASQRSVSLYDSTIRLGSDGAADLSTRARHLGVKADQQRGALRGVPAAQLAQRLKAQLAGRGWSGTGSIEPGDVNGNASDYTASYQAHVGEFAAFPGKAGIPTNAGIVGRIGESIAYLRKEPVRTQPFVCTGDEIEETTTLELGEGVAAGALPPDLVLHNRQLEYSSSYAREGSKIRVARRLLWHPPSPVCTPQDHASARPALDAIAADLRKQLIVESSAAPRSQAPGAKAEDDMTSTAYSQEKLLLRTVLKDDGSSDREIDTQYYIAESSAIAGLARHIIAYSATFDSVEISDAWTEKADGRRVPVPVAAITDQEGGYTGEGLSDTRQKVISFPEVEAGDRVHYHAHIHSREQQHPGHLAFQLMPNLGGRGDIAVEVELPAGRFLQAEARGFSADAPLQQAGRTLYRWTMDRFPMPRMESDAVDYGDFGNSLSVSTFRDYSELAAAYQARASDKAQPTPEIAALARKLSAGMSDPRAKALALSEWVRANIRYVAQNIGTGGVVPRAARDVLAHRYGDCKDHVALLEALLTSAGIGSTPALINYGNAFRLPSAPQNLNHVITYIPALDLYLDSTSANTRAGQLPLGDTDKDTLLTKTGQRGHTPPTMLDTLRENTRVRIAANGAARMDGEVVFGGVGSENVRKEAEAITPTERGQLFRKLLLRDDQQGEGRVHFAWSKDEEHLSYRGRAADFADTGSASGVVLASATRKLLALVGNLASEPVRTQPYVCLNQVADEDIGVELPAGMTFQSLPADLAIRTGQMEYRAHYQRQGDGVRVQRHFETHYDRSQCTPELYAALRPELERVRRDLASQAILAPLSR